ncbi:MAG: winged helix-turn-helix domain-containing protein, partial [Acidobacteria bacterium]
AEDDLHGLQARDRLIFEYWGHAMSYLPMSDYRYYLPKMLRFRNPQHAWVKHRLKGCAHLLEEVLERVRREGPLSARDFTHPEDAKRGTWWDWKPAKFALEFLFWRGDLMISERRKFQKVYDLAERVLPSGIDTTTPTDQEVGQFLVRRAVRGCGIVRQKDIQGFLQPAGARDSDWQAADCRVISKAVQDLLEAGEILQVAVEGEQEDWYASAELLENHPVVDGKPGRVFLLSPFDNLVIRRDWLKKLFEFEYTLECYLPEEKRQYGYFVFPILWGNRLVGRLDPKADRKSKTLVIRNLVFEPGFQPSDEFLTRFNETLAAFARFNGCRKYVIKKRAGRHRAAPCAAL